MENCKGGLHIRPRGVEDAAPCKPKGRIAGSADVRPAAFPQEPICLTREGRACPAPTVQSQLKQEQKPSIMSTTSKSKTMTEGPLAKQILLVSLPLALSNLLQILFNMSDVAVVGRFAGSTALGSVGSTATFVTLFTGFLIGLSNGVNVLVARFYGAGHPKDVSKTVHSALLVSLAAGVLLLFVGLFGSPALLELLNTKEDLLPGAILYLRVYFLGMPALALYNFGNAVFSAIGETKKPLAYLSFAGVLNILLNLFFVIVCKLDVAGVALASTIAQCVSAGLILHALTKVSDCYALDFRKVRLDLNMTKRILMLGVPAGLQNAIFAIANLFIQAGVNSFDSLMVKGNSAAANADAMVYDAMAAFYMACASFMSQNYGAGKLDRVKKSYFITLAYSFGLGAVLGYLACFASMNVYIQGFARLIWSLAEEGRLPASLAVRNRQGVPGKALLLVVISCALCAVLSATLKLSVDDLIRYANGNFVLIYLFSMAAGWVLLRGIWRLLAGLSTLLCAAVLVMLGSDALYAVALLVALLLLDHLRARHKALA